MKPLPRPLPKLPPSGSGAARKLPPAPAQASKAKMPSPPPPTTAAPAGVPGAGMSRRQAMMQARDLEEQRKFGLAPLAVDSVTGNEISPHLPQSVAAAPWFYKTEGETLQHQRKLSTATSSSSAAPQLTTQSGGASGVKSQQDGPGQPVAQRPIRSTGDMRAPTELNDKVTSVAVVGQATGFRAGACTNCGAMGHAAKQCTERKKRIGAQFSGVVTGKDTVTTDRYEMGAGGSAGARPADLSYEEKRDTAAGVDVDAIVRAAFERRAKAVGKTVEELEAEDEAQRQAASAKQQVDVLGFGMDDDAWGRDDTAPPAARGTSDPAPGENLDAASSTLGATPRLADVLKSADSGATLHNSGRQRGEVSDLPKYLVNLDDSSALYDPHTRSMRGNPLAPGKAAGSGSVLSGFSSSESKVAAATSASSFRGDNERNYGGHFSEYNEQLLDLVATVKDGEAGSGPKARSMFLPTENALRFQKKKRAEEEERTAKKRVLESMYGAPEASETSPNPAPAGPAGPARPPPQQ